MRCSAPRLVALLSLLLLVCAGGSALVAQDTPADGTMNVSFFYSNLSPYGHWIQHASLGYVWAPFNIASGWRPYTLGHWADTDQGWLWVSDEPFGWATYHYGRWNYDTQYGWLWVPGYDWGPAWVAWRTGGSYIGWAPLPPQVEFQAGVGLNLGGVNLDATLGTDHYCFVDQRSFLAADISTVVAPPARNVTIIKSTSNITKYTVVNNQVVNQGVPVAAVEKATGHSVPRYQVSAVTSGKVQNSAVRGNQVTVFRPAIAKQANVAPPPASSRAKTSTADLAQQHQKESAALKQSQANERTRLQQTQQQEKSHAAPAPKAAAKPGAAPAEPTEPGQPKPATAAQLTRQHQAETQAQQQQHQREQTQLAARQGAEKKRAAEPAAKAPPAANKPADAPKPDNKGDKDRKPGAPPPGAPTAR